MLIKEEVVIRGKEASEVEMMVEIIPCLIVVHQILILVALHPLNIQMPSKRG